MIPIVDDNGMNAEGFASPRQPDPPSKSDVRFLSDSDLLIPD
jgi:hypothetical protein